MQDIKFTTALTDLSYQNKSIVRKVLTSVRSKINDPLGKRKRD